MTNFHYGVPPQHYPKFYDSSSTYSSGEYVQYVPRQYDYTTPVKAHRRKTSHTPVTSRVGGWYSPTCSSPSCVNHYSYNVSPSKYAYVDYERNRATSSAEPVPKPHPQTASKPLQLVFCCTSDEVYVYNHYADERVPSPSVAARARASTDYSYKYWDPAVEPVVPLRDVSDDSPLDDAKYDRPGVDCKSSSPSINSRSKSPRINSNGTEKMTVHGRSASDSEGRSYEKIDLKDHATACIGDQYNSHTFTGGQHNGNKYAGSQYISHNYHIHVNKGANHIQDKNATTRNNSYYFGGAGSYDTAFSNQYATISRVKRALPHVPTRTDWFKNSMMDMISRTFASMISSVMQGMIPLFAIQYQAIACWPTARFRY